MSYTKFFLRRPWKVVTGAMIAEGACVPRGWGRSYWGYDWCVCHPVPFNWLVGGVVWLWRRLRQGLSTTAYEKAIHTAYLEGYENGRQDALRRQ